jgi:hypothetical protein
VVKEEIGARPWLAATKEMDRGGAVVVSAGYGIGHDEGEVGVFFLVKVVEQDLGQRHQYRYFWMV